jgi:hypothetical protein
MITVIRGRYESDFDRDHGNLPQGVAEGRAAGVRRRDREQDEPDRADRGDRPGTGRRGAGPSMIGLIAVTAAGQGAAERGRA